MELNIYFIEYLRVKIIRKEFEGREGKNKEVGTVDTSKKFKITLCSVLLG
jgi:hypothetical protein